MVSTLLDQAAPGIDPAAYIDETPDDFRVHGAVYTDPYLFRMEMQKVFGKAWVFIGHESEIPNSGDYKTATIGLRPVIMSRADDGGIHVLLNRCRHRGSVICREVKGNSKNFMCTYHGWVYGNDGKLLGIAKHKGGYPDDINKDELGLMAVPRVYNYRGLVFANMDAGAVDFLDYLGEAKPFLDIHLDRSLVGEIDVSYGAHRTEYFGNWKFQSENSTDGYHGDTVHESFFKLVAEFGNRGGQHGAYTQGDFKKLIEHRTAGRTIGFDNGHGIWESPMTEDAILAMKNGPHGEYVKALEDLRGERKAHQMLNSMNLLIFPSLAILHGQLRVVRPIAHDRTEVDIYFYDLNGVPDSYNEFRLSGYQRFFGPASFGSPDDVEIFSVNQTGLQAEEVEWLLLSRGMARETMDNKGVRTGDPTDETPQRAFHRAWKQMMAA
ncbi:MAG: Rieske 2Fe-2S domain-containing protein [Proteobacteria bacterium]|nr:Rieske 2Fe-2S domain-containing protein [Pseudomonadota bacterium]